MRNALVLVPLCIGLTSEFIVPTGPKEIDEFTHDLPTSKREINVLTEEGATKNNSIKSEILHLYRKKEDEIKKELYSEGADEEKNVNERSFVFVNQRWMKFPYKSHLIDTKKANNLYNINEIHLDAIKEPQNIYLFNPKNNVDIQYLNPNYKSRKYFPAVQFDSKVSPVNTNNYVLEKHYPESRKANKQGQYVHILQSPFQKPAERRNNNVINLNKTQNEQRHKNENLFTISSQKRYQSQLNNLSGDVPIQTNNQKDVHNEAIEIYANDPLFKDRTHEIIDELNGVTSWASKLFQHTLEEQIPQNQLPQYDVNIISKKNFKYCQDCILKINLGNYTNLSDIECKCNCGRYIHVKGSQKLKNFMEKRSICPKSQNVMK